jgi:succinylglutamate desuccinylase
MLDDAIGGKLGEVRREIGHAGGFEAGPTLIVTAGIHGNEPSGLRAIARVFQRIEESRLVLKGELVGLAGNLPAIAAGRRFVDRDFNRAWTFEEAAAARERSPSADEGVEDAQLRELLEAIDHWIGGARGPVVVIDLHTTSSRSIPFLVYSDTLVNRDFARAFPLPGILGVEEQLGGTMTDYLTTHGHAAIVVEGGGHDDLASTECHEAAIWLALVHAGAVSAADVPDYRRHRQRLAEVGRGIPPILETFHRHEIRPGDDFRMVPGFRNFQTVERGTLLATSRHGEIRAPFATRLFMPLYQPLGDDGFFFARPVNRLWLAVSAWLRRLGVPKLAPLLPGVRPHPERPRTFVVDRRIARFFAPQLFHLFGFRVSHPETGRMTAEHRAEE